MCGIAGFIDFNKIKESTDLVTMTNALVHRGPDGMGAELYQTPQAHIGFGHRRLSIIDLSILGAQPMKKDHLHLIFNGEIYNYKEIKQTLETLGHSFISGSDSEVLLTAFKEWGAECVKKFIGMFAFAIFDDKNKKCFIFRDRVGVKPLYLYEKNGFLAFASELKAFHTFEDFDKSLNENAIYLYFKYGYVPNPLSIFKHCSKLLAGHYIEIDLEKSSKKIIEYWSIMPHLKSHDTQTTEDEIIGQVEQILVNAFQYRMVADVPIGVFLSGGYDSSLVAAILQKNNPEKINTFTIGFDDDQYDESMHANNVAQYLNTNHIVYKCSTKEAQEIIPLLSTIFDEPFADSSAIPTYLVSKVAAQHVKVVLSADGGDEIFAGYNRNNKFLSIHKRINRIPTFFRLLSGKILKSVIQWNLFNLKWQNRLSLLTSTLLDSRLENIFDAHSHFMNENTIQSIYKEVNESNPQKSLELKVQKVDDQFNKILALDYQSTLINDMLVKVDRATMANSIEGREPLLDHRIIEYVAGLPSALKMKDGKLKYILKKISKKYLPEEIMERPKMGFGIPIEQWLKTDLSHLVKEHFTYDEIKKYNILHPEKTLALVNELMRSKNNGGQLWLLLTFQMWCKKWL